MIWASKSPRLYDSCYLTKLFHIGCGLLHTGAPSILGMELEALGYVLVVELPQITGACRTMHKRTRVSLVFNSGGRSTKRRLARKRMVVCVP